MKIGKVGLIIALLFALCPLLSAQTEAETPEKCCKQAEASYNQGNYKGALDNCDRALQLNSNYQPAYNLRAKSKFALGDYKGALADWETAVGFDPSKRAQFQQGIDEAKAFMNPKDAFTYLKRASVKYGFRDYKGAVKDCDHAIGMSSKYSDAYSLRANAKFVLCEYSGAIADWKEVIHLNPKSKAQFQKWIDDAKALENPKDADTYFRRANARYSINDYKNALEDCNKAANLNPRYVAVYMLRGNLKYLLADYKGALEDLTKTTELDPSKKAQLQPWIDSINEFLNSKDTNAYLNFGNFKYSLGDYKGAIADWEKAIELAPSKKSQIEKLISDAKALMEPSDAKTYIKRGNAKSNRNDYRGAQDDFDNAIKIDPNNADGYYGRGSAKYGQADYEGAIADWQKAIEFNSAYKIQLQGWIDGAKAFMNPKDADAYLRRANAKYNLHDYVGVIEDCDKAVELNPKYANAYDLLASAKDAIGDHNGAIADFDSTIKLNPQDADGYSRRGRAKYTLGDYKNAAADWAKAVELNPSYKSQLQPLIEIAKAFAEPKDAENYLKRAQSKIILNDPKGAIEDCDKAFQLNPKDYKILNLRGGAKNALGDHKGAIEDFDSAIKIYSLDTPAYIGRGSAKYALMDYQGAIADWEKAIELDPARKVPIQHLIDDARQVLDPKDADAYSRRGNAKCSLHNYQDAIGDFDNAIKLDPKCDSAYSGRGGAKFALADYEGAVADYTKAIELDPAKKPLLGMLLDNAKTYLALKKADTPEKRGDAKFSIGDYKGAKEEFDDMVKASPSDAGAYRKRGNANFALANYQDAIADWSKAIELDPSKKAGLDPWIDEAKSRLNSPKQR